MRGAGPKGRLGLLALLVLCAGLPSRAAVPCAEDALELHPAPGSVLPTNARFLLEGFGPQAAAVRRLVGRTLVLVSGRERVTLKVKPAFSASEARVAVLLEPRVPLAPNHTWTLVLAPVLPGARLRSGESAEEVRWHTGEGADRSPPRMAAPPRVEAGGVEEGEPRVTFRVELEEQSPSVLVGRLQRARGGTVRRYFAPVRSGRVVVGDGACGGWALEPGRAYRIRFEAQDSTGRSSAALPPIEFNAPRAGGP